MDVAQPDRSLAEQLRELTVAHDLVKMLISTLELPEVLRIVLARIKTLTRAEGLSLLLYDAERDELVFAATETLLENSIAGVRIPEGRSIAGWVARTGESAVVNDVGTDPRFYSEVDRVSRFATRSVLAVPIRKGDRVAGVLEVANRYDGSHFTEGDRAALEEIAANLAARSDPAEIAGDSEGTRELLARVAATVPSDAAALLLYDPQGRELVFQASRTLQPGLVDGLRIPADRGIAGWVARNRTPVRLDDVVRDPRYYSEIENLTHLTPRSMICVPMVSKDTLLGVIQVINRIDGSSFSDGELRLTQVLADHAAIAIENASLYRKAYVASITDDLTGLGNNRHFNRMLPELIAGGAPVSLLVLDFDNFKQVVDTYGHLVGARTIGYLGRLIGRFARPGDVVARFGGDEFVLILPATPTAAAAELAEKIREAIARAVRLEDEDVDISGITASVGVATFPDHAQDAESLFRAADGCMYAIKRLGKNAVAVAGDASVPPFDKAE